MKLLNIIVFLYVTFLFLHVNAADFGIKECGSNATTSSASVQLQMPFKLGFEFQEMNSLCSWALNQNLIQKKMIFYVADKETNNELWSLIIDTTDIEFITNPFTCKQRDLLEKCMDSMFQSFSLLVTLLNNQTGEITFRDWIHSICNSLEEKYVVFASNRMGQLITEKTLERPSLDWKPGFSPQVTIQHPLEKTIPLYFNLFGHERPCYNIPFGASLPYMDMLKNALEEGDSNRFEQIIQYYVHDKVCGLIFLHAFTLVRMTPGEDDTDSQLLEETVNSLMTYQQVDVKMKLALMSRRPFSLMWAELQAIQMTEISYAETFLSALKNNRSFTFSNKIPQLFQQTNYAEQFFARHSGDVISLLHLTSFFDENFYRINKKNIDYLLAQGVLSTTMLRNFKIDAQFQDVFCSSLLANYPQRALKSIQCPEAKRYKFHPEESAFIDWERDVLSPPLLLEPVNAMGYFNKPLSIEEKEYGEAIVEVRAISDVSKRFLQKIGLDLSRQGKFLKEASINMQVDSLKLFDFLNKFGESDINDFKVGLSYTVLKSSVTY